MGRITHTVLWDAATDGTLSLICNGRRAGRMWVGKALRCVGFGILLMAAALVMQSCGCLRKPTVSTDTRDSTRIEYRDRYHEQVRRDTTYVRDSVFIRDRGDTVLVYRDRYHYTDRFLRDTVRTTDTVYQTVHRDKVVVEVQKHVPTIYRWSLYVALAALAWIAFTVWRWISGRQR